MPAFLQPQDAPSVGRNGANSPYQFYTQSTYDEITGVKTDGSQICVSGLDCPYRFGHNWNTGNSFNFSIQYGIGVVSQTGKLFAMGSDAMNTRGSTSASTWTLNHAYSVGDTINPNDSKNTLHFTYLATAVSGNSGGTEPTWDTGCTTTCTDGGVTWTRTNTPCNRLRADFWQWTNSLSITAGDRIYPASGNAGGFIYQADRTHATSGSVPSWCQNYGCTTTNGSDTIVWTNIGVNDCRGDVIVFDLTSAKH